jgi:hypothetical protein
MPHILVGFNATLSSRLWSLPVLNDAAFRNGVVITIHEQ